MDAPQAATKPAVRVVRRPSDLLAERQGWMRRLETPSATTPTIAELQKHAEKFGVEAVVLTAVELGYNYGTALRLQDTCDRIEAAELRRAHPHRRLPKVASSEERVRLMMGIESDEEGGKK